MKLLILLLAASCGACSRGLGPVTPQTPVERQMLGLLQKFDHWDNDGDGDLNFTELDQGMRSLSGKPQEVHYTTAEVLDFYDTNHNRKISLREAQAGYSRAGEATSRTRH